MRGKIRVYCKLHVNRLAHWGCGPGWHGSRAIAGPRAEVIPMTTENNGSRGLAPTPMAKWHGGESLHRTHKKVRGDTRHVHGTRYRHNSTSPRSSCPAPRSVPCASSSTSQRDAAHPWCWPADTACVARACHCCSGVRRASRAAGVAKTAAWSSAR